MAMCLYYFHTAGVPDRNEVKPEKLFETTLPRALKRTSSQGTKAHFLEGHQSLECYSGYKVHGSPCSFLIGGQLFDVEETLNCWREPSCTLFQGGNNGWEAGRHQVLGHGQSMNPGK